MAFALCRSGSRYITVPVRRRKVPTASSLTDNGPISIFSTAAATRPANARVLYRGTKGWNSAICGRKNLPAPSPPKQPARRARFWTEIQAGHGPAPSADAIPYGGVGTIPRAVAWVFRAGIGVEGSPPVAPELWRRRRRSLCLRALVFIFRPQRATDTAVAPVHSPLMLQGGGLKADTLVPPHNIHLWCTVPARRIRPACCPGAKIVRNIKSVQTILGYR
mmetsp:Transcript_33216/g.51468  ORF Transcript_33216/g.51468 Transcript_33216/m.51468 type:complete len:220 (+) Transcript_33216:401-1060(+)